MKKVIHCEKCWHSHTPAYHLKDKIDAKGYPTSSPKYKTAHEEATKAEKAHFPRKDYDKLKHMDETIPKGQLIGKNAASGKITVSKKVPKPLRDEVAYHERVESNVLRKNKMKKEGKVVKELKNELIRQGKARMKKGIPLQPVIKKAMKGKVKK